MSSIDNLLNDSIDNIDELPSTDAWPIGAHLAKVKLEVNNKDPKKPSVIARLNLISTEEQADDSVVPANPGDQYTIFHSLTKKDNTRNDFALQQLKSHYAKPLVEAGIVDSNAPLSAVIDAYKDGIEMLLTTGQREYNGEKQMTIKSTMIAG